MWRMSAGPLELRPARLQPARFRLRQEIISNYTHGRKVCKDGGTWARPLLPIFGAYRKVFNFEPSIPTHFLFLSIQPLAVYIDTFRS